MFFAETEKQSDHKGHLFHVSHKGLSHFYRICTLTVNGNSNSSHIIGYYTPAHKVWLQKVDTGRVMDTHKVHSRTQVGMCAKIGCWTQVG